MGPPTKPNARSRLSKPFGTLLLVLLALPIGAGLQLNAGPRTGAVSDALLAQIDADPAALVDFFVTVSPPATADDARYLESLGFQVGRVFYSFGVLYALGTGSDILGLATQPRVLGLTDNGPIEYYLESATVATRARELWDGKSTSAPLIIGGAPADGAGIGVAIIDSGADGTHPDLAPALATNLKYVCNTPGLISTISQTCFGNWILFGNNGCSSAPGEGWVALPNTDTTSGHGTHVAGIVAGRGTASDGRIMGAAPGASLHMLGTGEGLSLLFPLEGLNWVACNAVANNIQVVSNSWGAPGAYVATDPINMAVTSLVGSGITVVFAAGNDGGTGAANTVSRFSENPTPGVVTVANYYDSGRASRTGIIDASSSRCTVAEAGTEACPDVSAPGTGITSAMAAASALGPTGTAFQGYLPYYTALSGTSMATPHVAGIVAIMNQAAPGITPASVESILESTAIAFASGGTYPSYYAGSGLVDAVAAVALATSTTPAAPYLPQSTQTPRVYLHSAMPGLNGNDGQVVAGAPPSTALQYTAKAGQPVVLGERSLFSGNTALFPLTLGAAANFRVDDGSTVTNVGSTLTSDGGAFRRILASHTFPAPGTYAVESQIDYGSGLVSFDNFVVRVTA